MDSSPFIFRPAEKNKDQSEVIFLVSACGSGYIIQYYTFSFSVFNFLFKSSPQIWLDACVSTKQHERPLCLTDISVSKRKQQKFLKFHQILQHNPISDEKPPALPRLTAKNTRSHSQCSFTQLMWKWKQSIRLSFLDLFTAGLCCNLGKYGFDK